MSYRAPGLVEKVGDALGAVRIELSGNLHRVADFIQSGQGETGARRGTVTGAARMADASSTATRGHDEIGSS